jgi:hypothetical protein
MLPKACGRAAFEEWYFNALTEEIHHGNER